MSGINVQLQIREQFAEYGEVGERALANMMSIVAQELWGQIRAESPVDHGRLAGSFVLEERDELTYAIFSNVTYALAVHDGSGRRTIRPRNARALFWPGARHPVASVDMPARPANKYAERAKATTMDRLEDFAQTAVDQAMEGLQ